MCPVHIVNDSHYTLLIAETVLHTGSFQLDRSFKEPLDVLRYPGIKRRTGLPYQVIRRGGHVLPAYPPASPILSVPLVAGANLMGKHVIGADGVYQGMVERRLQAVFAALLMGALAVVMYRTSRLLLPVTPSVALAILATFTSPIWSSASRALWADTWGIPVLAVVLHGVVREAAGGRPPRTWIQGTLLSWLYFVKPTFAIAIIAVVACAGWTRPRRLLGLVLTGAVWLGLFVAWSLHVYSAIRPPYYEEYPGASQIGAKLLGVLFCPSRGILVYCPIILAVLAGTVAHWRRLVSRPLAVAALAAIAVHVAMIANHKIWWGGFCYGPRYLAGLVPWLFVLAVMWRHARGAARASWPVRALIGVLVLFSGVLNGRGALSHATSVWNTRPFRVDDRTVWSVRYPQFLAGIVDPPLPPDLPLYELGQHLDPASRRGGFYLWFGWGQPARAASPTARTPRSRSRCESRATRGSVSTRGRSSIRHGVPNRASRSVSTARGSWSSPSFETTGR
ncbi:MAG: hypothetical protein U0166_03685 [Acidobacteriota bacterium]